MLHYEFAEGKRSLNSGYFKLSTTLVSQKVDEEMLDVHIEFVGAWISSPDNKGLTVKKTPTSTIKPKRWKK